MCSVYNYFYIDHVEVDSIWEQIIHKPEETIVTNKKEQQDNKDVGGNIGGTIIGKIEGHANMMSSNGEERIQKYVNSPTMRVADLLRYFDGRKVELSSVLKEKFLFVDKIIMSDAILIRVGMEKKGMKGLFEDEFEEHKLSRVFREEYDGDEEYELEYGEDYRSCRDLNDDWDK